MRWRTGWRPKSMSMAGASGGRSARRGAVYWFRRHPAAVVRTAFRARHRDRLAAGAPLLGRGYAAEAARAALRVGFEQLRAPEIVAFTVVENRRSRAVMAKLGMREDPVPFRHPALAEDHPLSLHVLYRLLQQDWRAASDRDGDGDRCTPVAAA